MNTEKTLQVLRTLLPQLNDLNCNWALDASISLYLQGMDVPMNDIDITTDVEGINMMRTLFSKYIVLDEYDKVKQCHKIECLKNGVKIDIYADESTHMKRNFDDCVRVTYEGVDVPVFPLPILQSFYQKLGREEKVDLIQKHLQTIA